MQKKAAPETLSGLQGAASISFHFFNKNLLQRYEKVVNQLGAVCALAIVFATTACENNGEVVTQQVAASETTQSVRVVSGRLVFTDQNAFNQTMTMLHGMDFDQIRTWEKQRDFSSLRSRYEALEQEGAEPQANDLLLMPDSRFATVLNPDGVFQIGKVIHKLTQKEEVLIKNADESLLKSGVFTGANVEKLAVKLETVAMNRTASANKGARITGDFTGVREQITEGFPRTDNGRPTRMKLEAFNIRTDAYASLGSRVRFQKDAQFAPWVLTDADRLWLYTDCQYRLNQAYPQGNRRTEQYEKLNGGTLEINIDWQGNGGAGFIVEDMLVQGSVSHSGITKSDEMY